MEVQGDIEMQLLLAEKMKKNFTNYKKDSKDRKTLPYLEARMELLQQNWYTFSTVHTSLYKALSNVEKLKQDYFTQDVGNEIQELYENMFLSIKEHIHTLQAQRLPEPQIPADNMNPGIFIPQAARNNDIRLPRIKIECFYGNYEKWVTFRNLYTALVHNKQEYSSVEKFYYLKANLSGEASRLINQYTITNENYTAAWDTLLKRYDNKRVLVNTALRNLVTYPKILLESSSKVRHFLDVINECLNSLNGLQIDTATWDPILIYLLVQKLDTETCRLWEYSLKNPRDIPKVEDFLLFLENRFQTLENLDNKQSHRFSSVEPSKSKPISNTRFSNNNNNQHTSSKQHNSFHGEISKGCIICNKPHPTYHCAKLTKAKPEARKELIRQHMGCFNCLKRHPVGQCTTTHGCKKCGKMHSTLLHIDIQPSSQHITISEDHQENSDTSSIPSTSASVLSHTTKCNNKFTQHILLATALVQVHTRKGVHILRCLLDQGSESSFITESTVQRLGLKRTPIVASVIGIASTKTETSRHMVSINIESRYNSGFQIAVDALVLSKISGKLPSSELQRANWEHIHGLQLADPEYDQCGQIDMLLGADTYGFILLSGLKKGPTGSPVAQNTELGWILSGPILSHTTKSKTVNNFHHRLDFDNEIKKLWLLDEISDKRENTVEENQCELHFTSTYQRDHQGRFIVSLPFKPNYENNPLGESRGQAISRFLNLEKKFKREPAFHQEYKGVILDYIQCNHMRPINKNDPPAAYFMPHHAVIKEHSTTSRLRVVFDASAKTTSGASLNDKLLIGPTIQEDLTSILIRWRVHMIVFSADITKMYRQIRMSPSDMKYQRILWRDNPRDKIAEYQLKTVTFGTAPASFLAIRSLQQLARDAHQTCKQASDVILSDFYVDDLLTGANTVAEAIQLKNKIKLILEKGGFELRKWVSNNKQFLQNIPKEEQEVKTAFPIGPDEYTKTLGMNYHSSGDFFKFKVNIQQSNGISTKRNLLSNTARLFDPLGWLAPVIITAKILFQELWLKGLTWDQELPAEIATTWIKFLNELKCLENIKIPRCIGKVVGAQIQLHGFCDASQSAYAAVVYVRITTSSSVDVTMLAAKTRVAPIKTISIPRLELCGALLLAELMQNVNAALRMQNTSLWAWTDSTIVLGWLRSHPSKYKTFVANRVVEIHKNLGASSWQHVSTEDNPADCATRGIQPSELKTHPLWWHGPQWLKMPEHEWNNMPAIEEVKLELKTKKILVIHTTNEDPNSMLFKYDSLNRLLKITAWCLRFKNNTQSTVNKSHEYLTTAELNKARCVWMQKIQISAFSSEYKQIQQNLPLAKNSKLLQFNPFIDDLGILRIGGRIENSTLSYEEKHPAILPTKNKFTELIIKHAHLHTLHGGVQATMAFLRRHVWILNSRNEIKKNINRCVTCFRFRAKGNQQIMGDLPSPRIQITRPFVNTGVDYAGPLELRLSHGRNLRTYKGYIALFICMVTKAIHLEAVSEQTSAAFLAAFNRFVARRGLPANVYSDNGTNFVGANRHLREYREAARHTANVHVNNGIQWHFIPPRSPHFGGLWEAGIKSMKGHLRRIMGNSVLSFEELTTILAQVEACLNSRPLCPMTSDHQDLSALTPGHFLVGRPLIAPPNSSLEAVNISQLRRWRKLDKMHQDFWKRWSAEYLSRLQQRPKWAQSTNNVKVGDLILLKEDNQPPLHWPLGRVVNAIHGKDNKVRVVEVITAAGKLTRCINKVCLLPILENYEKTIK